jgi:molecular chaperone DnaK
MSNIIGIDLGTTNSCVAILQNNKAKVLENSEGNRTTPSIVAYTDDNEQLVGITAKNQRVTNPENTLFSIKRLMGKKFNDPDISKEKENLPYKIIKTNNGDVWVEIKNKKMSPQQISAAILIKMKKTAEDYLGHKVTEAVITVPAYFNDAQRQATKDAGKIAGLEVKRIINEPTAAALAYGMDKKKADSTIAVYDLGGGTFDISIIEIANIENETQFEVLATNGNTSLGGEDLDNKLMNFLISEFKKETGINLKNDAMSLQRLKEATEKAKIELSTKEQTEVNLPYITATPSGPKHLQKKITRSTLESLVEDLIKKTLESCEIALKDSGKNSSNIDEIILVGGQTRMPLVQKIVKEFFNKEPKKNINPDEAVAIGAVIQGGVLSGSVKDVLLLDVTPLSLGLETMGDIMTVLIDKNSTIPTKKTQTFSTATDNQPAVNIKIYQGERAKASNNKLLGQFDLTDIPPAPRGIPQIEVNFDIDSNGILKVSAKDKGTQKEQNIIIKASGGLSEKEVNDMVKDAEINQEKDENFKKLISEKNNSENLINSTEKLLRENKDINEEDKNIINKNIEELKTAMKKEDLEQIKNSSETLSKISSEIFNKKNEQPNPDVEEVKEEEKTNKTN